MRRPVVVAGRAGATSAFEIELRVSMLPRGICVLCLSCYLGALFLAVRPRQALVGHKCPCPCVPPSRIVRFLPAHARPTVRPPASHTLCLPAEE